MGATTKDTFITKVHVMDIESEDLHYKLQEEFKFVDIFDGTSFTEIQNTYGKADNDAPIKIDDMINMLNSLKENGCTHVEVDYHTDHIEYQLSGYIIEHSTKSEIKQWEDQQRKNLAKYQRIRELQAEINEIQKT